MKAITLYQPWASAIACGLKVYETRSWKTSYRGPLAIHAAKNVPLKIRNTLHYQHLYQWVMDVLGELHDFDGPKLPTSCIVTAGILDQCIPTNIIDKTAMDPTEISFGDYSSNRFAWKLTLVHKDFEITPCDGKQGMWTVPQGIETRVTNQFKNNREWLSLVRRLEYVSR